MVFPLLFLVVFISLAFISISFADAFHMSGLFHSPKAFLIFFFLQVCCPLAGAIDPFSRLKASRSLEGQPYCSFSNWFLTIGETVQLSTFQHFHFYIGIFTKIISITSNCFKSLRLTTSLMCLKRVKVLKKKN